MQARELSIPHAIEFTPKVHHDDRGKFLEWYRFEALSEAIGHPISLKQANTSVSSRGTARGIHFAQVPRGQAKYVTVTRGSVMDFVVDVRVGSPTFGRWESVLLDDVDHRALYLAEGLGHAIVSLSDDTTVTYLVSEVFTPSNEFGIDLRDPEIALELPLEITDESLSPKDRDAPGLAAAAELGILPSWDTCLELYQRLALEVTA